MEKVTPMPRPAGAPAPRREMTFVDVLAVVLRHRRLIVGLPLVFVLVAVVATLLQKRQYTATASFMPRASDASRLAGLGGLAAQIGVSLPAGDPGQSPDFYADLVVSREILGAVVDSTYAEQPGAKPRTLVDILDVDGATPQRRHEEAIRELTKRLTVNRNIRTGVIQVGVRTTSPELSRQVTQRILDRVNDFNLRQRQERAAAERQFAEERLRTIRAELYEAEEAVADFQRRNRTYRGSPELTTEADRLARNVSMRQQLFTSFSQLYEQSRIDAVRNTPLIMLLDRPLAPSRPDSRRGVLSVLLALVGGVLIALLVAFARDATSAARSISPSEFDHFEALRREAGADFRRPWRLLLPRRTTRT